MPTASMRLILDQGVPRDAAGLLREMGYECIHVGEIGMAHASDEAILSFAVQQNAVVITLDADFHAILAVSGAEGPSVIRIRMQGLNAAAVFHLLQKTLSDYEADLTRGCLITIKAHRLTCHKLPIGGDRD